MTSMSMIDIPFQILTELTPNRPHLLSKLSFLSFTTPLHFQMSRCHICVSDVKTGHLNTVSEGKKQKKQPGFHKPPLPPPHPNDFHSAPSEQAYYHRYVYQLHSAKRTSNMNPIYSSPYHKKLYEIEILLALYDSSGPLSKDPITQ